MSKFADCVVLVGPEHIPGIRKWQALHGKSALQFIEVPEPSWGRFAKRHRISHNLLYLFWLERAYRIGLDLHKSEPFDVIYHPTFSTYWLPTPGIRFGVPFIWGPIGGAVTTPWRLWPVLGFLGVLDELLDFVAVRIAALWPATRRAWRDAALLLVQNDETLRKLPASTHGRAKLLNHAMFADVPPARGVEQGSHILCLSSFESRKGPRLVVEALAYAGADVRLVMVTNEKGRKALLRHARKLGVADRVEFRDPVPRAQVFDLLAEAAAVVFTGLREEGGMTLAEALLSGTPVIVLGNGGARTLAEAATDPGRVLVVEPSGLAETRRRIGKAMTQLSRATPSSRGPMLDQKAAQAILRDAFETVRHGRAQPKPNATELH